jgi:hypothetical protein
MSDTWLAREQRRFNYATFQRQPKERRVVVRRTFTEAQLRIAIADFERRRKTA